MFDPLSLAIIANFVPACHQLLAVSDFGPVEGRRLTIAGGKPLDGESRRALSRAAIENDTAAVYLEFGQRVQAGPERVQVIIPRDGVCYGYDDCVFCPGGIDRIGLMKRDNPTGRFTFVNGQLSHIADSAPKPPARELERVIRRLRSVALNMKLETRPLG